ncbi:MAG: AIR synthase-related protein, partial [Bacteroidia bacterium]
YAPIIKEVLNKYRTHIHGMVHCSGGGQTKVLHFIENAHVIKDNLFELPPLFKLIHEQSGTEWKEMYQVFNMGHRMELYVPENIAKEIIAISQKFNVEAQIIGRVEKANEKKLTIQSQFGEFIY